MSNKANGAFGSELFNQSIPIGGTQSNTTNQPLPTPKNTAQELSSGVPVSEHDRMTRMIQEKSAPVSPKEIAKGVDLPAEVLVPWAQMEKKADKALFLAQQGKQANEIARLVGWSSGSVKTTFSSWKKKQLVNGRASNIKPMLHESHLPTFRHLFLVERIGKNAIIERYDFHPDVVDDAFYRLKREKRIGGSPDRPLVIEPVTRKPVHNVTLPEARAIITECFIEKKMNRDKIANIHPAVEPFITKVFGELLADGELLGSPMNPIVKTKVPEPVYQVGQNAAPPLREKDVTPKKTFKPKFDPLPKKESAPKPSPSTKKADDEQIEKLKETLDQVESPQESTKETVDPPSPTKPDDAPQQETTDGFDADGFDESISAWFKEKREKSDAPLLPSNPTLDAVNEIVAHSHEDNPYVQSLKKQLEEERALSKKLASEVELLVPWSENPSTKELQQKLYEANVKIETLEVAQKRLSNGITDVPPSEPEDDGTFLHLAVADDMIHENHPANKWVVSNGKPFVSSHVQTEVGRLTLQESEKSIEEIQSHINLLIQSLTVCGATHFAIDLTLKGQK